MVALVERLGREGATRTDARRLTPKAEPRRGRGRPKSFVFRFKPRGGRFALSLQFKRARSTETRSSGTRGRPRARCASRAELRILLK